MDKRSRARAFAYPVASSPRARLDGARARFASLGARVEALTAGGAVGVKVCSGSEEGPAALRGRADLVVDGPPGVVALLRSLL